MNWGKIAERAAEKMAEKDYMTMQQTGRAWENYLSAEHEDDTIRDELKQARERVRDLEEQAVETGAAAQAAFEEWQELSRSYRRVPTPVPTQGIFAHGKPQTH